MKRSVLIFGVAVPALALLLFYLIVPAGKDPLAIVRFVYGVNVARELEFDRLRSSRDTAWAYERAIKLADSRVRARSASAMLTQGLLLRGDSGVSDEIVAHVGRIAREELAALGVAEPRHPIAIVVMRDTAMTYPRFERAVVLPDTPGGACAVVLRLSGRFPNYIGAGNGDRLLGTCGFFAVYGAPGAGMRGWLERTNMRSAGYLQPPASHGDGSLREPGEVNAASRAPSVVSCRTGNAEACSRHFNAREDAETAALETWWMRPLPEITPPDPRIALYSPFTLGSVRAVISFGLLANLAERVGPERFAAIWTSDVAPEEAYARVADAPLTAWVTDHLATQLVEYRAGPGLPGYQWVLALGLVGIPLGLVLRLARRRLS